MHIKLLILFIVLLGRMGCSTENKVKVKQHERVSTTDLRKSFDEYELTSGVKTIHVFVALCDNLNQGIVPVPKAIGNGQDPENNLYWGCGYGVKTYFKNSSEWTLLREMKDFTPVVLRRAIFKHKSTNTYLVADAFDGAYIKTCTREFLESCAGKNLNFWNHDSETILGTNGNANLLAYVGHDGLMEFSLDGDFAKVDKRERDCMILACASKDYFAPYIKNTEADPLLWTSNLMAPEAYTLHDAIEGYINGENGEAIRTRAAKAYHKYQKCGMKGARNLLVTGF